MCWTTVALYNREIFCRFFKNSDTIRYQNPISRSPIIEEFLKIAKVLCQPEVLTLEEKIAKFLKSFKNLSKVEAKQQCQSLLDEVTKSYDP